MRRKGRVSVAILYRELPFGGRETGTAPNTPWSSPLNRLCLIGEDGCARYSVEVIDLLRPFSRDNGEQRWYRVHRPLSQWDRGCFLRSRLQKREKYRVCSLCFWLLSCTALGDCALKSSRGAVCPSTVGGTSWLWWSLADICWRSGTSPGSTGGSLWERCASAAPIPSLPWQTR